MDDSTYRLEVFGIEPSIEQSYHIKLQEVYSGVIQTYFLDEKIFEHRWTCSFEEFKVLPVLLFIFHCSHSYTGANTLLSDCRLGP